MNDLKLYGKSQDEADALLGLVQEYSNGIWNRQVCNPWNKNGK